MYYRVGVRKHLAVSVACCLLTARGRQNEEDARVNPTKEPLQIPLRIATGPSGSKPSETNVLASKQTEASSSKDVPAGLDPVTIALLSPIHVNVADREPSCSRVSTSVALYPATTEICKHSRRQEKEVCLPGMPSHVVPSPCYSKPGPSAADLHANKRQLALPMATLSHTLSSQQFLSGTAIAGPSSKIPQFNTAIGFSSAPFPTLAVIPSPRTLAHKAPLAGGSAALLSPLSPLIVVDSTLLSPSSETLLQVRPSITAAMASSPHARAPTSGNPVAPSSTAMPCQSAGRRHSTPKIATVSKFRFPGSAVAHTKFSQSEAFIDDEVLTDLSCNTATISQFVSRLMVACYREEEMIVKNWNGKGSDGRPLDDGALSPRRKSAILMAAGRFYPPTRESTGNDFANRVSAYANTHLRSRKFQKKKFMAEAGQRQ